MTGRSGEYLRAFDEPEPLVSVVIPTYDRGELLAIRAIPWALGQTYPNIEIVIVGDGAPPETGRLISQFVDGRLHYGT
jgi:glycosyltransferase involved in cell wall biosynthesis